MESLLSVRRSVLTFICAFFLCFFLPSLHPSFLSFFLCRLGMKITATIPLQRGKIPSYNEATWVVIRNASRRGPGDWVVHDSGAKVVTWPATLWPLLGRDEQSERPDAINQLVKFSPNFLYDCPERILQIGQIVANKYLTLFHLKGARRQWHRNTWNHLNCVQTNNQYQIE